MPDLDTLYAGCSAFFLDYTEADEVDSGTVDLLVSAARDYYSHMEQGHYSYAELALEASSTYVQCDLSSYGLEEYVEMFENYLLVASESDFGEAT